MDYYNWKARDDEVYEVKYWYPEYKEVEEEKIKINNIKRNNLIIVKTLDQEISQTLIEEPDNKIIKKLMIKATATKLNQIINIKKLDYIISELASIGIELVYCKPGSFYLRSPEFEIERIKGTQDYTKVELTKPFMIGKYLVTQKQFFEIMEFNPSYFEGDNNPVESVEAYDAIDFCEALNSKFKDYLPQGYKFDLPSEAQWEYACRAGTNNHGKNVIISQGKDSIPILDLDKIAWHSGNSNQTTHPVGQKTPNGWGIYDMHGNVAEYAVNNELVSFIKKRSPKYKTKRPLTICGGSFSSSASDCHSASREYCNSYEDKMWDIGFRIALVSIPD